MKTAEASFRREHRAVGWKLAPGIPALKHQLNDVMTKVVAAQIQRLAQKETSNPLAKSGPWLKEQTANWPETATCSLPHLSENE